MDKGPRLTICSVYHSPETKEFLELNWELVSRLNSAKDWIWTVMDNTPSDSRITVDEKKFIVYKGLDIEFLRDVFSWPEVVSFHHSMAINYLFIVYPEWINSILEHMIKNDLGIFGATYHPQYYKKYRYFPACNCTFIDSTKIDLATVDFTQQFLVHRFLKMAGAKDRKELNDSLSPASSWERLFRKIVKFLGAATKRTKIGYLKDTGYLLYKRFYGRTEVKYETLQAVFRPDMKSRSSLIDAFFPDRWSYIPKKKDYYATIGFREKGLFDFSNNGFEEHMWQGKPFAVHVRRVWKRKDIPECTEILKKTIL